MISQTVFDTSKILSLKGVTHVVLSPGSRNAPLTISFSRNPDIKIYNIIDERSAGFIALGMAQKLQQPVVLCCTSGTALLNYAPAIAEAWYQQIPLIVMSADRPPEWQGQRDGQTIHQVGSIGNFVKETFELPTETDHEDLAWEYSRKLNEAANLSTRLPQGPVHINIPFREPFYPQPNDQLAFSDHPRIISPHYSEPTPDLASLTEAWQHFDKRLIIPGQQPLNPQLNEALGKLTGEAVVIGDVISNVTGQAAIRHHDLFLASVEGKLAESLQPDLLVTFGKSVISKNLKIFLRKHPPREHWHIDEAMVSADPFQSMSKLIQAKPGSFLTAMADSKGDLSDFSFQIRKNFSQNWAVEDSKGERRLTEGFKNIEFSEFSAFAKVIKLLPQSIDLHVANSMPVRYANFIQGLPRGTEVFANRGTSGIDGTNGTAVGGSLVSERPTILLTGDLSFFYDRNAFFHQYDLSQLVIIVFNNGGGGIFRLIPGPSGLPELEQHFETRHNHSARFTAMEYGFDYYQAKDIAGVEKAMKSIVKRSKTPRLLEIFTDPETNHEVFTQVKKAFSS